MIVKAFSKYIALLSLLTTGFNFYFKDNKAFQPIETEVASISEFCENGVKLQYSTLKRKEDEIERILSIVQAYGDEKNLAVSENEVSYSDATKEFKALVWQEDEKVFVEVTLINKDPSKDTQELKKEIEKLQEEHLNNIRYFEYYKGKIKTLDEGIDGLKFCSSIKNLDIIPIKNGYSGSAKLKNGQKVSLAVVGYNTGNYVVVGTPTIFATY